MIAVRNIDYQTDEGSEKIYTRLTWSVEKVDSLFGQLANGVTVKTDKPWVGVYDKEKMKFGLIEPSNFLNPNFIQVVVKGQIIADTKTKISIKFGLGWYPIIVSLIIFLVTIGVIIMFVSSEELSELWKLIIWMLIFPGIWTILLNRKIDKMEEKVEDLLGMNEENEPQ